MGLLVTVGEGATWDLPLAEFRERLIARWPDAQTVSGRTTVQQTDYLNFQFIPSGGTRVHGTYFLNRQLVLDDEPVEFWADTIVWFLRLLPRSTRAECFTDGAPVPHPLPLDATREQVIEIFNEVDAAY